MPTLEIAQKKLEFIKKAEEYYNALCTNIQLSGDKLKVISVTSVNPGEGKTTTSVNIARSFARAGYKTLLIDGDTRNSVISGVFKSREKITGLTEFLSGTADLSYGLCDTNIENLFVVQSGSVSPNPTALLQSKNFNDMIETLRKYFDYIIVDTPPVGIVIDAVIITQKCDASILVTATGEANKRDVQKAKQQLEQTGKLFLGVVLNKLDISVDKYGVYASYGNYGKNNLGKILWIKKDWKFFWQYYRVLLSFYWFIFLALLERQNLNVLRWLYYTFSTFLYSILVPMVTNFLKEGT